MILIPLGEERPEPNPLITGYQLVGWNPDVSPEELWERLNPDRAGAHSHVAFQWHGAIVQVAKIDKVTASPIPGKIVFEGEPLPDDDPFARLLVGKASHGVYPQYLADDRLAEIITSS